MNRLNGQILVGMVKSPARFDNAKYVCADCFKVHTEHAWTEFNLGTADYCEVCERSILECSNNGYLITNIRKF